MNYLKTELLKYRKTSVQRLIFIIPIICAVLAAGFCCLGGLKIIRLADITILNHWGLIWLPASVVLITGLAHKHEAKSTGYQLIFGLPIKTGSVWLNKVLAIALGLLAETLILWGLICLFDLLFVGASVDTLRHCLGAALLSWVSVLWQIPVYLWLAGKISYFLLMILNCAVSLCVGPIYAARPDWWTVPWAWTLHVQSPLIGLHPNGIPLESGSWMLGYSGFGGAFILLLCLSGVSLILFTHLFTKRKVG